MQSERDLLRDAVHPAIVEVAQKRGVAVELIDLRWGIETSDIEDETDVNHKILQVCLDEIDRCKPFIIVLLGERYGWVPPAQSLSNAANEKGFVVEDIEQSVTALEIEYGALAQSEANCFFYFRDSLDQALMDEQSRAIYIDSLAAREKLDELKRRIIQRYPDRVRSYQATFDPSARSVGGLDGFMQMVIQDISEALGDELGEEEVLDTPFMRTVSAIEQFTYDRRMYAVEKKKDRDVIARFLGVASERDKRNSATDLEGQENKGHILALLSRPGGGKSTLIAELLERYADSEDMLLIPYVGGLTVESYTVAGMLRFFIEYLNRSLGLSFEEELDSKPGESEMDHLILTFDQVLKQAAKHRQVVIVVDSLDALEKTPAARYLLWLSQDLPDEVRVIVSQSLDADQEELRARKAQFHLIEAPAPDDTRAIIEQMSAYYHKEFPVSVIEALIEKESESPLYLSLLVQDLLMMDSSDFAIMNTDIKEDERQDEAMARYMRERIQTAPNDLEGLYAVILKRVERRLGAQLVHETLGLLALSQNGLREKDIEGVIHDLNGEYILAGRDTRTQWSSIDFSLVRRMLHRHFRQTEDSTWTFANHSLNEAMLGYLAAQDSGLISILGEAFCAYLYCLESDDVIYQNELVYQAWKNDRVYAAAGYLADYCTEPGIHAFARIYEQEGLWIPGDDCHDPDRGFLLQILWDADPDDDPNLSLTFADHFREIMPETTSMEDRLEVLQALKYRIESSYQKERDMDIAYAVTHEQIDRALLKEGHYDKAFEAARTTVGLWEAIYESEENPIKKQEYARRLVTLLESAGLYASLSQEYQELSLDLFEAALSLLDGCDMPDAERCWIFEHAAEVALTERDFIQAASYAQKALPLRQFAYEKEKNSATIGGLAYCQSLIGKAFLGLGIAGEARAYLEPSLALWHVRADLVRDLDTQRGILFVEQSLGDCCVLENDHEGAKNAYLDAWRRAGDLFQKTDSPLDKGNLDYCKRSALEYLSR